MMSSRECQRFLSWLSFVLDATHSHTHVRVGFSDYKLLIHAATDNPFLLYSTTDRFDEFDSDGSISGSAIRALARDVTYASVESSNTTMVNNVRSRFQNDENIFCHTRELNESDE